MILWAICGVALALVTLVGTLQLLVLTLAGWRATRPSAPAGRDPRDVKLAVVVPAHDEAAGIARTVQSLITCDGVAEGCDVVVVADNCTDDTAGEAERAGARVLVRDDPERRGKGFALDFAFQQLWPEGHDAFAVVDADTVVDIDFLDALRRAFAAGAQAAQARYLAADDQRSLRTQLVRIAFAGINVIRPRGRERLGLSAGIVGNGFALARETLAQVPYAARSIVEDLEYHLELVRAGKRVRFVDETAVRSGMPASGEAARGQQTRWEGGRLRVAREHLAPLWREVFSGRLTLLEPAADLMLLPLAFHTTLLVLALLVPFAPTQLYAFLALLVVALHVLAAIRACGGGWAEVRAVMAAPFYVLWKLGMAGGILRASRRDAAWVRTEREPD